MIWLVGACLVFVVVSHLIQVQKLDEILDWINQPDEDIIEGIEPIFSEPLGVTEIKVEEKLTNLYFDPSNSSKEFMHLFSKTGSYIGVRANGHPDSKDEHYDKFWPNGDSCLMN